MRAILSFLAFAIAAPSAMAQPAAVDVRPWVAQQVAPKVHLLSTPDDYFGPAVGNVTLIEQSDGFVVIDSGAAVGHGRKVVEYARSLSPKPIKAVAITHWHNDHPLGVSAIRDAYPDVRVISTPATEEGLLGPVTFGAGYRPDPKIDAIVEKQVADAKASYRKLLDDPATASDRKARIRNALSNFDGFMEAYRGSYVVLPSETFERELLLDDADVPVRLLHLGRANTPGDLLAWMPAQKIVSTGDIVVAPVPFGFFSYPADWIATIARVKSLGFTTLIPGHGGPQTDSNYLDKLVSTISEIRSQVGPLAKAGMPLEEVKKKVDFGKATEAFSDDPRVRANLSGLFFDPMVPSAYKEALGQPIIQGEGNPVPEYRHTPPEPRSKRHSS